MSWCNKWNKIYCDLLNNSIKTKTTYELINYTFSLNIDTFICPYEKIFDIDKAHKMFDWYKRADEYDCSIEEYFPGYKNVKNKNVPYYNSNYGLYIYKENQFDICLEKLKKDSESRQAQIIINRQEILHNNSTLDKLCTQTLSFLIRDNKLFMITNMRSNDAINLMPYDVYSFTTLMLIMHDKLLDYYPNLEVGKYIHNVLSLHVYNNDIELLKEITNKNEFC